MGSGSPLITLAEGEMWDGGSAREVSRGPETACGKPSADTGARVVHGGDVEDKPDWIRPLEYCLCPAVDQHHGYDSESEPAEVEVRKECIACLPEGRQDPAD